MGAIIPLRRELSLIRQAKNRKPEDWVKFYGILWHFTLFSQMECGQITEPRGVPLKEEFFDRSRTPKESGSLGFKKTRGVQGRGSWIWTDENRQPCSHLGPLVFHSFQEIYCQDIPDAQFTDRSVAKRFQVQNVSDFKKSDLAKQNH